MVRIIKKRDLQLISELRKNARQSLADISRKTDIPVTTIYDNLKLHERKLIKGYTALLDFRRIGFNIRASIVLKTAGENRKKLESHLLKCPSVNSLYQIDGGFDFLIEALFRDTGELIRFMDNIEDSFSIKEKHIFYMESELKKETFLSDNSHIKEIV